MGICCMAKKLKQELCINLEKWDGEGDEGGNSKGRGYMYTYGRQVEVWQKTTKFCKPIILQLKKLKIYI